MDMFLFGIATNLYQLFLFRAIQGAASGIVWPVATVMAADIVKPKHRGKAMGLFSMMWDLGLVLGPVIGGVLSDMFSMSTPFYFTSILAFSSCILIIFRVRETAHRKESDTAPVHRKKLTPYMKTFIGLCVAGFGTAFAMGFVQPVLSVYSNEILGLSKALIGITFGIMALFRLITKPIAGDLSDRHGKRIFILIGRSINSVFTFTIIYAWSFLSLIPSMILRGIGSGMGMPTANALTTSIAYKENRGKVMGWYSTARNIGLFMGPILGGWAYDNIGKTEPFILCGIVGMITVVVIFSLFLIRRRVWNNIKYISQIFYNIIRLYIRFSVFLNKKSIFKKDSFCAYKLSSFDICFYSISYHVIRSFYYFKSFRIVL